MSRPAIQFFFRTAVFFWVFAAFQFAGLAPGVHSMDFLKPEIEKRIESALPGFEASITRVGASYDKGFVIEGFSLSSEGRKVLRAETVSVSYGSLGFLTSSGFVQNLFASAEIEIRNLELFPFVSAGKTVFPLLPAGREENKNPAGSGEDSPLRRLPKIKIADSVFNAGGERIGVHESEIFIERGEEAGELKVVLKNGHLSLPARDLSVKDLSLTSKLLTAGGLKVESVDGNGIVETSGRNMRAEFGVFVPENSSDALWKGRLFLSGVSLLNRNGEASLNSVALGKDGVLSIRGRVSLGSLSSRIKAAVNLAEGSWIPQFRQENGFEIEADIFRRHYGDGDALLPLGKLKTVGNLRKKGGLLEVSANLSQDYKLDLFDVGMGPEKSGLELSLKNYRVVSGNLFVKSPNLLIKSEIEMPEDGGMKVNYEIESKDVFHLSKVSRHLRKYRMSGAVKSSGRLEKSGGEMLLSGKVKLDDFAATVRKRIRVGNGEIRFTVPVERFPFEDAFVKSSLKDVSYGEIVAKKINFGVDGDTYAEFEFENGSSFNFLAGVRNESGKIYAEVKKAEFKADDLEMSLFRSFAARVSRGEFEIGNLYLFGGKSHFRFSGSYGREKRSVNFFASFSGLDTKFFEPFHPSLASRRGLLSGEIVVDGPANWPVADIDLKYKSVSGGTVAGLSIVRATFSERFSVNLSVDEGVGKESGSFLKIAGGVSPAAGTPREIKSILGNLSSYDLTLKAERFGIKPIRFLSNKIKDLDGVFSGSLSVFNDGGKPDLNGEIDIYAAKVKVEPWTDLIEFESAKMAFRKDRVFSSFRAGDSFGEAEGNGSFNIRDFSYSGKIVLEGIYLKIKHLHSGFYGTLFLDGSGRNIKIRGEGLKTEGANIWIKRDYNAAIGDLVFVDSPDAGSGKPFAEGKTPGFFSLTSDLDFSLRISEDTKFKLDKVNSLLTGELRILRKPGENFSVAKGELTLLRGSYGIFGKQFSIDKGSVSFSSRAHLSPIVDIKCFYETSGLSVKANLYGETNSLKLQLSSVPAMQEDEIVLALLTNNKKDDSSSLGIMKEIQNSGTADYTVLGYAADELFSSVLDNNLFAFVDVFSITRESGGIFDSDLEVGTYITGRLYFSYERVNEFFPISDSYENRFTAEYDLTRHLVLEGVAGGLTPGFNLLFNFNFK